jgi:hypothetical protein
VAAPLQSQLETIIERFYNARTDFAREIFGITPWSEQEKIFTAADTGERRLAVKSGHRIGKSLANAVLIWHHLICRYPQKCAVTAPSEKHLFDALWAEFRGLGNRFTKDYLWLRDLYDITAERAVMKSHPAESFVSIKVSRPEQTEALQGMYAEHVLLIADEASGIPEATFEAAMSSMANPHVLFVMTSQPIRTSGFFADAFRKNPEMWWKRTVSSLDSPFAHADYINFVKEKYGEDSNAYRIRVLGEFPTAEEDKVIPRDLIEAATKRQVEISPSAPVVWGLDVGIVARSALAKRQGNGLKEPVRHWRKLDTMETAGRVKHEWDVTPQKDRPVAICIDAIGLGRGVADRLRELGLPSRAINVSETPALIHPHYKDLRSELWFAVREWLANRDTVIPDQEELIDELAAPDIKYYSSGKTGAEPKDSMKRRGVESPDLADAVALTFAVDATVLQGQSLNTGWDLPPNAPPWRIPGLV